MQQVEIDTEKHILTQTKKLSDGSNEKIFSRNPRGQSGYFTYNCHLCGVPNLPGEKALQTHITGKKHQNRLLFNYTPDAVLFRSFMEQGKTMQQTIFPGEPIPPGFEDEMKPACFMDAIIAKVDKPLIGLEYVLELHDMRTKEPLYVCTLCDKRCDPRNIIPQITSHRHRMKYLEHHFESVMNILNRTQRFNVDMSYREDVLTKVAKAIEERSKRQKPTIHEYKKYDQNKTEITDEIKNMKHFDEKDFPECVDILSNNNKADDFEEVSSSDSEFQDYNESSRDFVKKKVSSIKFEDARMQRDMKIKIKSIQNFTTDLPMTNIDIAHKSETMRKILTPRELSEQSNAKMHEKYLVEKYKASVQIAMDELDKKFKEYTKNPEKHPLYSEEWKSFWSRRYKELISEGKDANSHDYKPEWIKFWMERMEELHNKDKKSKKIEIRRKLNLTIDFVDKIENESSSTLTSPKRIVNRTRSPAQRSRSPARRSRSPTRHSRSPRRRSRSPYYRKRKSRSPIEISDESDEESYRKCKRQERKRIRYEDDRSHSKFSESPMSYRSSSNFRDTRRSPSPEIYSKYENEINLVSVCRLLSALESELGILAGRIIDLLTKAVAMEKSEANSCDSLLFDNDHMILMETAKERLKGGLSAGLVASHKVAPVKRAIQQIAALIHETNKKKETMPVKIPNKQALSIKDFPQEDPNEAARLEIARVLTQSLLEQGRDDISPEELEEMIEAFMQEGVETIKTEEPEPSKPVKSEPQTVAASTSKHIEPVAKKTEKDDTFSELENLTDDDLKTLLRNFSDLTCDEQNHLITYLSKIENTDRQRVERLRKYVDIGDEDIESDCERGDRGSDNERDIPPGTSKNMFLNSPEKTQILSDDEYEDTEIVKSINATLNSEPKPPAVVPTLANTGAVANELMSSLMTSFMQNSTWEVQQPQPQLQNTWEMPQSQPQQQDTWEMAIETKMQQQYQMPSMMVQPPYYNTPIAPWVQPPVQPPIHNLPMMPIGQFQSNGNNNDSRMENRPRQREVQDHVSYRKRLERPNNMQLTGKGTKRR